MEIEAFEMRSLKVGITTKTLEKRYREALKVIFKRITLFEVDALVLENRIKLHFADKKDSRIKFAGMRNGERWTGDTELFLFGIKDQVINYIDDFISSLPGTTIDYEAELGTFIVQIDTPKNVSIEKSDANKPISVLGIDPFTEEIKERFESLAEAERNGYDNISLILSEDNGRSHSGGLRWFRADTFDPNNIPPLEIQNAKPVYCVERNQHFRSTIEAEEFMRTLNFQVAASKISAVLSPNSDRRHTAGFTWEYSQLTTEEILNQNEQDFIDHIPPKNSNEPKSVKLTKVDQPEDSQVFKSMSDAGRLIGSDASVLSKAIKNKRPVKGYWAEIIANE